MPAPAPMSKQEKLALDAEISKKIEWSVYGNTITAKLPVVEIPTKNPIFRIVRVFSYGTLESGYRFKEDYFAMDFGPSGWVIDIGKIYRNYKRATLEKRI